MAIFLLGRNSDLVKIGGKRESLSGLSYKLKKIDGVDDGIFFIPKEDTNKRVRLAALVVSSTLTRNQIIQLLSQIIDPVFLPRPLKVVASLPYNKLGP
jgi:acyl-coenzyme A synthetase/AMP-(fatty) acid ligase